VAGATIYYDYQSTAAFIMGFYFVCHIMKNGFTVLTLSHVNK